MKIVIFGLTISSSWGNGHATLWRGLCKALIRMGHDVVFYEHDTPYYATMRDLSEIEGGRLILYDDWAEIRSGALADLSDADAAIVTSYCPDGLQATDLVLAACRGLRVFYDLDTPVTLSRIDAGEDVPYMGSQGLRGFDLVLSYGGGRALDEYRRRFGVQRIAVLYGHVDPELHHPSDNAPQYRCDLSYLGTYSADRQPALETLFVEAARRRPASRFLIGGAQYPQDFPWSRNIYFVQHVPPAQHPAFFCSSRLTLNVTRAAMKAMGWCPSGRLFEAAACGVPLISDRWDGLSAFFEPGDEIIVAESTEEVVAALDVSDADLRRMADRAQERVLTQHSSAARARELVTLLEDARRAPMRATAEIEA